MKDEVALLTIGQLVDQLKSDFPDLSITKVRYLEDRGLLAPSRTPGRYRKYTGADARRLRAILTLQRDQYLPLEVIRERVDVPSSGLLGQPFTASAHLGASLSLKREDEVYTQEEFCENAGIDTAFLRLLVEYRLIERRGQQGLVFTDERPRDRPHLPFACPVRSGAPQSTPARLFGGAGSGACGADNHTFAAVCACR